MPAFNIMSLDDGCMFCPRRRRRQRRRRRRRRLSFGPAMFFRGCDSDLRREKRDENPSKQCGAATTQDQRATSCWTISIADHHRRRGVRMMAMMPAIVRSREAASERASNRGKCLTSLPLLSPLTSDGCQTIAIGAVDRGGQLQLPDGRTYGCGRPMHPSHRLIRHCRDRVDFSRRNATGGHVWKGSPTESNGSLWHRRRREEKRFPRLIYNPSPIQKCSQHSFEVPFVKQNACSSG